MAIELFNAALPVAPAAFAATQAFVITSDRVVLNWEVAVTVQGELDWFFEYGGDAPNAATARWYREVAEEDQGGGVTEMPLAVRTLRAAGSPFTNLPIGTTRVSMQLVRTHQLTRVRARMRNGAASLQLVAVFGAQAAAP